MAVAERVRTGFFHYGWLLPVMVPSFAYIGRAGGSLLLLVYLAWALLALRPSDLHALRPYVGALWLAMVVVFAFSVPWALDPDRALHGWISYSLKAAVFPITWIALSHQPPGWSRRLAAWLAVAAVLALAVFSVHFFRGAAAHGLLRNGVVYAMPAAYLSIFAVAWLAEARWGRWSGVAAVVLALVAVAVIALIPSTTELLVVVVALLLFAWVRAPSLRRKMVVVVVVALPMVFFAELYPKLGALEGKGWVEILDSWGSQRPKIWRSALTHPPENGWVGVGMKNLAETAALRETGLRAKHMHLFLLDVWFEVGVLGLAVFIAFFGYLVKLAWRACRRLDAEGMRDAAPWVAGAAGIVVASSLDKSYSDLLFVVLLPMLLAAIHHRAR